MPATIHRTYKTESKSRINRESLLVRSLPLTSVHTYISRALPEKGKERKLEKMVRLSLLHVPRRIRVMVSQ